MPSQSNASAQSIARMSSLGVLGGSPEWRRLLPTEITDIMPVTEQATHDTIDPSNQFEAPSIVGLTCAPKYRGGFIAELANILIEAATRCSWSGPQVYDTTATRATSATAAHFVVPAQTALPENTLVFVSGCVVASNNGVKHVAAASTTTNVIITGGLTAETFSNAQNVSIEVCGFQFATGDLTLTTSGGVTTIGATAKNLTQLGLVNGQEFYIGSDAAAAYAFATAADYGPARVTSTPAAASFTAEAAFGQTFVTDGGGAKTIRLLFGRTLRVVARTDANYIEPYYQIETSLENLGSGDASAYNYNENCALKTFTLSAPSKALMTMAADFMATDATVESSQRTNASAPSLPKRTAPYNTTSDINGRIYLVSGGTAVTGYITSANLVIENNTSDNPAHGVLGSAITTWGKVAVRAEVSAFLVDTGAINAARNNTEVKANWWVRNAECAYAIYIPSARIANGQASFSKNQIVTIDLPTTSSKDPTHATSLIVSRIPGCPALPARAA